jgi:hypothetical protein
MKPGFLILFSLLISLLTGCERFESNPDFSKGKIRKILNKDEQTIGEFKYDNLGIVKESWLEEDFYTPGEKAEYSYTFDSKNRLIKKTGYEPGIMFMSSITGAMGKNVVYSYEYDDIDRIERITVDYDYKGYLDLNYSYNFSYEYPDNSSIIESANFVNPLANSIANYNQYHFNSNSNIDEMLTYNYVSGDKRISSKTEYEYDKKNAPFSFDPKPISKNNVLKKTITTYSYDDSGNQIVANPSVFTYEYTYNEDDFPISKTETSPNETVIIKYFLY